MRVPATIAPEKGSCAVANGERLQRFGAAMARARQRASLSQAALGVMVGSNQSTVSSWERGESEPPPDLVFAIEDACEEPKGALSRLLGYLPIIEDTPDDVETAILSCPKLDPNERELLRNIYVMMASDG